MEQKKALWISLSAGIFLLTVFGVALFCSYNNAKKNVYASALKGTDSFWVSPPVAGKSQSYPTINVTDNAETQQPDLTLQNSNPVSGTYTPAFSNEQEEQFPAAITSQQPEENHTQGATFNIGDSSNESNAGLTANAVTANAVTAQNKTAQKAMDEAKTEKAAAASKKPAAAKTSTAKTTTNTAKANTSKTANTAKTGATSAVTQYWIQVSSYSDKKHADEARSVLDANNMPCEVFTFSKDGTMYYRVRVGPYTTKGEADKAKTKVDGITMFKSAGSYVVSVKKEN